MSAKSFRGAKGQASLPGNEKRLSRLGRVKDKKRKYRNKKDLEKKREHEQRKVDRSPCPLTGADKVKRLGPDRGERQNYSLIGEGGDYGRKKRENEKGIKTRWGVRGNMTSRFSESDKDEGGWGSCL